MKLYMDFSLPPFVSTPHISVPHNIMQLLSRPYDPNTPQATYLRLNRTPLHALPRILLPLLVQKLALLIRTKASEFSIALLLLQLIGGEFTLLCFFFVVSLADLGDLFVARLADAAQGFGAEVRGGDEVVGETQEVLEEGEGVGVVRGEFQGEVDALAGLGVVESVGLRLVWSVLGTYE